MMNLIAQTDPHTFNLRSVINKSTTFGPITGSQFTFPRFVQLSIRILFVAMTIGFFLNLLVGATQWILAGGDKEAVEKARKRVVSSITGLVVGFSVYLIANLITAFTGINILNDIFIPRL